MNEEPAAYADERSRRIEQTVARDLARRRRLIRVYLLLLLVPLIAVAAHMVVGRTDRKIVEDEVRPVKESYEKIAPVLAEVGEVGELLPEIRAVGDRFQNYEQGQQALDRRVNEVAAEIGELQPAVADARAAKAEVAELRQAYEVQQQQLSRRIDAFELRLGPRDGEGGADRPPPGGYPAGATVERLSGRTAAIEDKQAEMSQQLARLLARPPQGQSADVEALKRRVRELEATVDALQEEIRRLRSELEGQTETRERRRVPPPG